MSEKNRKRKLPRLRKKTKRLAVVLLVAFVAIVSGLTISSVIMNKRAVAAVPYNGLHDDTEENEKLSTLVVNTDEDISNFDELSGSIGYDKVGTSSYVVNYGSHEEAVAAQESLAGRAVAADMDFVFHITSEDPSAAQGEIEEIPFTSYAEEYNSGKSLRQIADETGKKIVAVIDTGVNTYATVSKNFTDGSDEDLNGHGTSMARTIVQTSNDNSIILSLKAMDDDGIGTMSQVYQALQYAKEQNVDIVNMSISAYDNGNSEALKELIQQMIDDGITVVAAAGNYSSDVKNYIPANIDGVIVAGTENGNGIKTDYSNYGDVDYYLHVESTSEAAATLVGMISGGKELNNLYTSENIVIESYGNNDDLPGYFATQANNDTVTGGKLQFRQSIKYWRSVNDLFNRVGYFDSNLYAYMSGGSTIDLTGKNVTYEFSFDNRVYRSGTITKVVPGENFFQYTEDKVKLPFDQIDRESPYAVNGVFYKRDFPFSFKINDPNGALLTFKGYIYWNDTWPISDSQVPIVSFDPNGGIYNSSTSRTTYFMQSASQTSIYVGKATKSGNVATVTLDYGTFSDSLNHTVEQKNVGWEFAGWQQTVGSGDSSYGSMNGDYYYYGQPGNWASFKATWKIGSINLPTPSHTGYTFNGWYTAASGGTRVSGGGTYTPSGNVTLYAHWTRNSYSLDVNANVNGVALGGLNDGNTGKQVGSFSINVNGSVQNGLTDYCQDVPYYSSYSISNVTAAAGYKYTGSTGSALSGHTPANAISISLNFVGIDYTIRFDSNCTKGDTNPYPVPNSDLTEIPTGSMANISARYGTHTTIPANNFSWAGHTFLGWSTNPDATTATYTSGSQYVLDLTTTEGSTVTLYAVWKPNSTTMKVNPNGGTWNGSTSTQSFMQTWGTTKNLGTPTAPNRLSTISFDLNIDLNDTNPDNINAPHSATPDSVTLKYIFNNWTVQSGGKGWMDGNVYTYQSTADTVTANYYFQNTILPVPTREGFTFLGWYYEPECLTKAGNGNEEYRPENDTEKLYARWQKNTFNYKDTITHYVEDDAGTQEGKILLRKIDVKGSPLTSVKTASGKEYGFVLEVYKGTKVNASSKVLTLNTMEGLYDGSNKKLQNVTTDPDGWYDISSYLTLGETYTVHEAEAAPGYFKAKDQTFVASSGEVVQVEVEDSMIPLKPPYDEPVKTDQFKRPISKAIFALKDETTGQTIGEYTTNSKGNFPDEMYSELIAGHQYSLTETNAPEGYELAPTFYIDVPATEDGEMPEISISETATTKNLEILKVNSEDKPLEGAEFALYTKNAEGDLVPCLMNKATGSWTTEESDETMTMTGTTDGNGKVVFRNLPLRASFTGSEADFTKSYYLVETKAPEGYNKITTVMEIRLEDVSDDTLTYTVKDGTVTLTLEAGGAGTKMITMLGGMIVAIGTAGYVLTRRKR